MLKEGPYPLELKRRIKGSDGHLSNLQARELLGALSHRDLGLVVLAHLSQANNIKEKAYQEAKSVLDACDLHHTEVMVSHQDRPISMQKL
jgi:phosphoribosyl 1,2-cyclic phosphodiesterase